VSTVKRHKVISARTRCRPAGTTSSTTCPRRPRPTLHPGPGSRSGPDDLAALFPMDLIEQEVATEQYIDIPPEVLDVYRLWRPSPLYRAHRLEAALGTPAHIYYKYEGVSPAGLAQAQHLGAAGVLQRQGRHQEAHHRDRRRAVGHLAGLRVRAVRAGVRGLAGPGVLRRQALPPPDDRDLRRHRPPVPVRAHRRRPGHPRRAPRLPRLARHRDLRGGRGRRAGPDDPTTPSARCSTTCCCTRRSSARRRSSSSPRSRSPRPHHRLHRRRVELRRPVLPVPAREARRPQQPVIRGVEPASCPSLTQGTYAYDFGDTAGMTPLMKMHTLGHDFIPDPIHAGGLRYHGMSPLISHVYESGLIEAVGRSRRSASTPGSSSPAPRASSRPLSRPTRIAETVAEACAARRPARRRSSSWPVRPRSPRPAGLRRLPRRSMTDHSYEESEIRDAVAEALTRLPAPRSVDDARPAAPASPAARSRDRSTARG
jgi:tryptophan synthase beta chain